MRSILLVLLVSLASSTAFAQKLDASSVDRNMKKVLAADQLQKSKVGIYAVDVETDEVVYSMNADEAFNPASNVKLVTAATALEALGPEHVFVTRLSAKQEGSSVSTLYLHGDGDPLLMWEDLLAMASELKARGVSKVTGGIVVDDSAFSGGFIPPGYDQKDEDASYRAPIGAVSLNYNAQTLVIRPGTKQGEKARVYLLPPNDNVEVVNDTKTSNGTRAKLKAKSETSGDGTKITLGGTIGLNAETQRIRKRIDNPTMFTGSAMLAALQTAGIEVAGGVKSGKRPGGAKTLVYHESPALAYVVFLMNKWSNNFMAEMLYHHVSGAKGVDRFIKAVGLKTAGFKSFNGSGLYDGNTITPKQIVELLDWMTERPAYPEFSAALAVAGQDGTLARRLAKPLTRGKVRGKTGTLNNVTALSGYMVTKSGRTLAYSILINDPPVKAWTLRRMQDELAEALAGLDK